MLNLIKEIEGKLLDQIMNEAKTPQDESIKQGVAEWKLLKKKLAVIEKMSKAVTSRISELEGEFQEVVKTTEGQKAVIDGAIIEITQKKGNVTVKYKEAVDYALKMVNEAQKKVLEDFVKSVTKSPDIKDILSVTDPELEKYLIDLGGATGDEMMTKIEDAARAGFDRLPKQVAAAKKRELKENVIANIAKVIKNAVRKFKTMMSSYFKSSAKLDKAIAALVKVSKADPMMESQDFIEMPVVEVKTEEVAAPEVVEPVVETKKSLNDIMATKREDEAKKNEPLSEAEGINRGIRSIVASIKAIDVESDSDSLDAPALREIMVALKTKWDESNTPTGEKTSDGKLTMKVTELLAEMVKAIPKPAQED